MIEASGIIVNLPPLVALVVGLFGLIVLTASAFAVIRATYIGQQLELVRKDRDDQKSRVATLESENELAKTKLEGEKTAREAAESRISVLEKIVTGSEQLQKILTRIDDLEVSASREHAKLFIDMESLIDIGTENNGILKNIQSTGSGNDRVS